MSARHLIAIAAVAASLAACETVAPGGGYGPGSTPRPSASAFRTDDFVWSARSGRATIDGRVDYRREGRSYACSSVALTPDTPYTRARFQILYGSTARAAIPEAVVRARTVADPNADYRSFVRQTSCENNRFQFDNLPDGSWFVIAPVSAGGDRIVLMRQVATRSGRIAIVL